MSSCCEFLKTPSYDRADRLSLPLLVELEVRPVSVVAQQCPDGLVVSMVSICLQTDIDSMLLEISSHNLRASQNWCITLMARTTLLVRCHKFLPE